ncbi:thiopeptide-type bacteriocin biosynthesis protein [Chryseobacterium shigense]|nr:thiopeptide-type bacteriocin biosynthesis protein [Chryseobacterium shigense]
MNSVRMSSENFYQFLLDYDNKSPDKKKNIELTFYKYFSRAANRPTPFGMFSGIGLADYSQNDGTAIPHYEKKLLSKVDYHYLDGIIQEANENEIIKEKLTYTLNNTMYPIDSELVYIQKDVESVIKKYKKNSIENDEVMSSFLNFCVEGKSMAEIINFLQENFDVSEEESHAFFSELVNESIIFSNLNYSTIGKNFIPAHLLELIISEELRRDHPLLFDSLSDLYAFQNHGVIGNTLTDSVRSDLNFQSNVQISLDVVNNLKDALSVFEKLSQNSHSKETNLEKFIDAFNKKYGEKEVSLVEALDTGYGHHQGNNNRYTGSSIELNKVESLILKKSFEAIRNGKREIEIEKQELSAFTYRIPDTATQYCSYSIFKDSQHAGRKILNINFVSYASPIKVLGRFTENKEIHSLAEEIHQHQKKTIGPHFILAEIEHLPTYLAGHIVKREINFDYIIRYPNDAPVNDNQKYIDINDLYVNVFNSKIYLRSKKLNQYVIPTFSAFFDHNHIVNSPIFKFLLDVSTQYDEPNKNFIDTQNILNILGFSPQIRYKNHILKKAHWLIKISDFFKNKNENIDTALSLYKENASKLGLKKTFCIVDGEQELYINEDLPISVEIFLKELRKKNRLIVCEAIHDEYEPFFRDESYQSINLEIITPLKNKHFLTYTSQKIPEATHVLSKLYPFIHDCVYFKLFVNKDIASILLLDMIPYLKNLVDQGFISHFVFLYYYAPDFHIRFRVFSTQPVKFIDELNKILKEKISHIDTLQYDTYDREITRYHGDNILFFEKIYYWDSLAAHQILKYAPDSNIEDWLFCIKTALYYIDCFFQTYEDKLYYIKKIKDSFAVELGITSENNKDINRIILENKDSIDTVLSTSYWEMDEILEKIGLEIATNFEKPDIDDKEHQTFDLIHMHLLRIIKKDNRFFEYIIYCILEKKTKETYHRDRKNSNPLDVSF